MEKIKSVTVDYRKWTSGRLRHRGKFCILGFVAKEAGVPEKYMSEVSRLNSLHYCEGLENLPEFLGKTVKQRKSSELLDPVFREKNGIVSKILEYNDNAVYIANPPLRMALLYKLFKENKIKLVFENVPPEIMTEFRSLCRSKKKLESAKKKAKNQEEWYCDLKDVKKNKKLQ